MFTILLAINAVVAVAHGGPVWPLPFMVALGLVTDIRRHQYKKFKEAKA